MAVPFHTCCPGLQICSTEGKGRVKWQGHRKATPPEADDRYNGRWRRAMHLAYKLPCRTDLYRLTALRSYLHFFLCYCPICLYCLCLGNIKNTLRRDDSWPWSTCIDVLQVKVATEDICGSRVKGLGQDGEVIWRDFGSAPPPLESYRGLFCSSVLIHFYISLGPSWWKQTKGPIASMLCFCISQKPLAG